MVRVEPDLRGQIEGHRKPGGALREQVAVAGVGLCGGAIAGVLAHRPKPAAVERGVDAAREGIPARKAEVALAVPASKVLGPVEALGVETRSGLEPFASLKGRLRLVPVGGTHAKTSSRFRVPGLR